MVTVADCLRQHAPAYLNRFGDDVPLGHRKVISAITRCRTGELGGVVYQCDDKDCRRQHWVGRSCGNRHCPTCQADRTTAWLQKQSKRLLPVHHFLVTFTVPDELRAVLRANQKAGYDAIFDCGSQTLKKLATNPKFLGTGRIGFFGVLHTWGRDPTVYHPHVHFVVPGGGVSEDGARWLSTPTNFLFPAAAMATIYKTKFADAMRVAGLYDSIPASVWKKNWVVNTQPVGDGQTVLKYLAPYVFRVAISDKRIEACDEHSVTFRYTPSATKTSKIRTVSGREFVRGFVQHVLPRSLQKVRHYGWMSSNNKSSIDNIRWIVWLWLGWTYWLGSGHVPTPTPKPPKRQPLLCVACGNQMRRVGVIRGNCQWLVNHSREFLDSG